MASSSYQSGVLHSKLAKDLAEITIRKSPDAVFWVGRDARIFRVNEAACQMHGYTEEEFKQLRVFDLTNAYQSDDWNDMWAMLRRKQSLTKESHHIRKDGTIFPIDATIFFLEGENLDFCACFIRDISERKEAEKALQKAYRQIENLKDRLADENLYLRQEISAQGPGNRGILTNDPGFEEILTLARRVAPTASTVLLNGETGTGKELLARLIHEDSPRRDRSLIKVNCATLPAELIESELFGHEKGSFSGAYAQRKGRFELADGGTLFLDEIGELPLDLQSKLLRVLQEGEFERIGGQETLSTDVRVIAATNRNLEEAITQQKFREDLYYRLNIFPLKLPPLRDRLNDIPLLARHFIEKHRPQTGSSVKTISPSSIKALQKYSWPGNIRELENIIERALILSTGKQLELPPLPHKTSPTANPAPAARTTPSSSLKEVEIEAIQLALTQCGGKIEGPHGAARKLEIAPSTLRDRIRKYGLS
ncbi:MAG: sigma 54-interacting transcriptional regulator [Opitutales bacterium]|nr:sigma 54-interacting transcriptional regulator [Opitutales bacterium]